ncbi:DUF5906 domain-containing protein [uncultured Desulfosarcina sp.]|uniref:phage NrS-1 polymerase family protein n=1 Tax=uncultured Desulfosarcina sp. TaxID=218289 RepID=UPI0029C7B9C0|nr:DUF5906 domain-containing protein [uncultured Desulfosarcina sp.]
MELTEFLPVNPQKIPEALKPFKQWVVWKAVLREEKWTKVPYIASSGRKARVNNLHDWIDFETAFQSYQESKGKFAGIGFVLTEKDPIAGIDIDDLIKPGEDLELEKLPKKVRDIVYSLNTYTEISPSGTGLRLFVFGTLPKFGRKKGSFEFYESGRFLTITGHHLEGTPKNIQSRQQQLTEVHASIFGKANIQHKPINARSPSFSDDGEIMQRMLQSATGGKIQQLLSGNFAGYPSQSEADQALCGYLAFWYGRDAGRMDAVFKSSGLYREKWDRKHHSDGRTYGQATIERAISQCSEVYTAKSLDRPHESESDSENQKSDEQFLKEYRKISDPDPEQIQMAKAAIIRVLNRTFAAILIDGKFLIIMEHVHPATGRADISYLRKQDFLSWFENRIIITGYSKGKPTFTDWAKIWLKSPYRREYNGLILDTRNNPKGYYNLYKPPVLKTGPSTCELYLDHVKNIICGGHDDICNWVLDWMAYLVQNKGRDRPGTAIVLRGSQGTGKGSFVQPFGQIFGNHFIHVTQQAHFTGRFTEHFKDVILAFIDEALWAGNRGSEGHIKGLISEATILIEPKFVNPYPIKNHVNFIFASNSTWIVPTGLEERRFLALHVKSDRQRDYQYFHDINQRMKTGGVADLARFLMARKVTCNLREAVRTEEFLSQAIESMTPEEHFWFHLLQEGELADPQNEGPNSDQPWPDIISRGGLYTLYCRFSERLNIRNRLLSPTQFGRRVRELVPTYGGPKKAFSIGGKRFKTYRLPPLEIARKLFEEKIKYQINWDNDDEVPF